MQINLSTTARMPDGLSTTFVENVGSDDKRVYGPGLLFIEGVADSPPGFPDVIQLEEPFLYDPAQGNLLMDVRVNEDFYGDAIDPFAMDASNVFGDSVSRVYVGYDSPTGATFTSGLVTAFVVTPVPEPSSVILFIAGLALTSFVAVRFDKPNEK